jgi:hypothetical protein
MTSENAPLIAQVTKLSSDPVTLIIEAVSRRNLGR